MLSGEVTANLGDDFARYSLRDRVKALFVASQDRSPRWPEAQTLTAALEPFGVKPPSPNFLARFEAAFAADMAELRKLKH
jgi:hypothetical protein